MTVQLQLVYWSLHTIHYIICNIIKKCDNVLISFEILLLLMSINRNPQTQKGGMSVQLFIQDIFCEVVYFSGSIRKRYEICMEILMEKNMCSVYLQSNVEVVSS